MDIVDDKILRLIIKSMKGKVLFFFLFFLGNGLFVVAQLPNDEDKSVVIGTSFFVSEGTDVTLPGGLKVNSLDVFHNEGTVCFKNQNSGFVRLPSGDFGDGEFMFKGSANIELNVIGDEDESKIQLANLKMDMPTGSLSLKGNLSISGVLDLKKGIVNVDQNGSLLIGNTSTDAILFNDSPLNQSYVNGYLSRKVSAGKKYYYPVGNARYYHPFTLDKPSKDDVISVSFDENVPKEIGDNDPEQATAIGLIKSYGWRVESNLNQLNKFFSGLSLYNTSLEGNANLIDIYHFSDADSKGMIVPSKLDASILMESELNASGLLAFSQSVNTDKFLNFIYVNGDNKTNFEIPYLDDYTNVSLKMYNHLGSLIFKNAHYSNDLDVRNFSDGTYFYELMLEKEGKQSVVRKFIEIAHEK